jgi:hypothetical protein
VSGRRLFDSDSETRTKTVSDLREEDEGFAAEDFAASDLRFGKDDVLENEDEDGDVVENEGGEDEGANDEDEGEDEGEGTALDRAVAGLPTGAIAGALGASQEVGLDYLESVTGFALMDDEY